MPSVLDLFGKYLEHSERSPLTIKNYLCDLDAFVRWFTEINNDQKFDPAKITPTDLREYKQWLVVHQGLKPNSTNRKLATLRSFINWAGDVGVVKNASALKMPRFEKQERMGPRWLDRREQNSLLRAVERGDVVRDIAIVKLLLNTGLRVDELCSLTWKDVTLTDRKGTLIVRKGKGSKRREVPLNRDARNALSSVGYKGNAGRRSAIFFGQRGRLMARGLQNIFAKYAERAKLDVSPHSLRHTFCKNLVNAGVSLEKVAALAGHESLETTRRYTEPSLKDLEMAVALIGEEE
jgi:site-specific recombinase XerD